MTHKLVNWCVFNMYVLDPCCFCRIWALRVSTPGSLVTKSSLYLLLLLVKSFKYDKLKLILNLETLIWLRLKERENFWIKKLKTLTPYSLNQELNWYHVVQYPHPQCSLYLFSCIWTKNLTYISQMASNNIISCCIWHSELCPLKTATSRELLYRFY